MKVSTRTECWAALVLATTALGCASEQTSFSGANRRQFHHHDPPPPRARAHVAGDLDRAVFRLSECKSGRPLLAFKVAVFADISPPNKICAAHEHPGGKAEWVYGTYSSEPCPPLRPGHSYLVWLAGDGSGEAVFEPSADGSLAVAPGGCGPTNLALVPNLLEERCRTSGFVRDPLCAGVALEPPPALDIRVAGTAASPVFSAASCDAGEARDIWYISVYPEPVVEGERLCLGRPGGTGEWEYGTYSAEPCPPLEAGKSYVVGVAGVGKGSATFRFDDEATVSVLKSCGKAESCADSDRCGSQRTDEDSEHDIP